MYKCINVWSAQGEQSFKSQNVMSSCENTAVGLILSIDMFIIMLVLIHRTQGPRKDRKCCVCQSEHFSRRT